MKKIIVIAGSVLVFCALVTATLGVIDYKMKHKKYITITRRGG